MRNLVLLAALCLAPSLMAVPAEMEVVGHTAAYLTAEPVANQSFAADPVLRWYTYANDSWTQVAHELAASVKVTGGPSDAGGLYSIKVSCEFPQEADRPKNDWGESLPLYVTLQLKGGEHAGTDVFEFQAGRKIARVMSVEKCSVKGVAVGADGKPLAQADVKLISSTGAAIEFFGGKTNDNGEFTVFAPYGGQYDLAVADLVSVAAYNNGWSDDAPTFIGGTYGMTDLGTVKFVPAGSLAFSVMTSMPEYSYVEFVGPQGEAKPRRVKVLRGQSFSGRVAGGKYTLEVSRAVGWDIEVSRSEFEVKAGESTDLGDVGGLPGEKKIWMDLKLAEGADASRAYVSLTGADGYSCSSSWNAENSRWEFVVGLATARTFSAKIELEGYGAYAGKIELGPESESFEVTLQALGTINASAEDENGEYLWCTLFAISHGTKAHEEFLKGVDTFRRWRDDNYYDTRSLGATELYANYATGVAAGKYTVLALTSHAADSTSKDIEVVGGEATTVRLSPNTLEVKLTFTRNGAPFAEREVVLLRPSDYDPWRNFGYGRVTDAQGCMVVGMRAAGRYSAKTVDEDLWNATILKEVEARAFEVNADTKELAIDLTPRFSSVLVLEVVPSDNDPIMGVEVLKVGRWVQNRSTYGYDSVRAYTEGGVEYGNLEPGMYRASCYCENWTYVRPAYVFDFEVKGTGVQRQKFTPQRRVLRGQVKVEGAQKLPEDSYLEWYYLMMSEYSNGIPGGTMELDGQGNYEFKDPPLIDIVLAGTAGEARGSCVVHSALAPSTADFTLAQRLGDLVVRIKAPFRTDYRFSLRDAAGVEYTPDPMQVWQHLGTDGAAVLAHLPAGKFDLHISADGCLHHVVKDVQILEGKTVLVETSAELKAAPFSRWRVRMPKGLELDASAMQIEFLDEKGNVIENWSGGDISPNRNISLLSGWSADDLELSLCVVNPAVHSIKISVPECKAMTIAMKDFPEDYYNEWGELNALEFERS